MITFGFIKDYLRHRLTAQTRRGLHFPFVRRLLNEVIYDYSPYPVYNQIEVSKRGMLPNSRRKGNRPRADQLLYRLVRYFNPCTIAELGTGMGISKLYMAKGAPESQVISLESDGSLKHATSKLQTVDFLFINYYNPAQLFTCFETLLPKLGTDSVLVICNIYSSPLAKQNWQHIKDHAAVTCTIDLFWLQLVFFKHEWVKEHYRLKF